MYVITFKKQNRQDHIQNWTNLTAKAICYSIFVLLQNWTKSSRDCYDLFFTLFHMSMKCMFCIEFTGSFGKVLLSLVIKNSNLLQKKKKNPKALLG